MRIAVLYGPHDFRIEERPSPKMADDECLIKVRACGVCHSEIHQWDVKEPGLEYPRFIGHEVAGEILQVGSHVARFKPGDRVAVWTDRAGYAEEVSVKETQLFAIKESVPFEHAMAEPISCTVNGVEKTNLRLGDSVALVGTGFMGLILLQEIKLRGATPVIAIDLRDEMLELAKRLGADIVLNPNQDNVVEKIKAMTDGRGIDVAFEVGGVQSTLDLAADILRMEGKLVIFGYHPGPRQIKHLGFWNWMAFDIVNAHFRNLQTILNGSRVGMQLLNAGQLNMAPLITHTYPLDRIEEAFTAAKEKPKGFIKSVIVF